MQAFIYILVDKDWIPCYVGKTCFPKNRKYEHSLNFPGTQLVIIEVVSPEDRWQDRERFWIAYYSQYFLLKNKSKGGGANDFSAEARIKLSQKLKGRPKPPRTPEHSAKISLAKKGKPGHRKGVVVSSETRRKQSEIRRGRPWSIARRQAHERRIRQFIS